MYRQWTRYLARTGNPPVIGENDIDVIINYTIRARDNFPNWQSKLHRVRCIQGKRPPCYQYRSRVARDPRPSISVNNPDHLAEWNCLGRCEGGVSSINTYDSQILTWGRGQGGATGPLPVTVNLFCQNDLIAGQKLFDVGIFVDFNKLTSCSGRNAWNVIDINNRSIRSGSGGLMLIAQDIKLLSVLIDIAEDSEHSQAWVNAQFRVFSICRSAWTSCKVSSNPPLQCDLSAIK
jgi:hypothetical protein